MSYGDYYDSLSKDFTQMDFFEVVPRIFLSLACSVNQTMSKADTAKVLSLCFFEKAHHLTRL